MQECLRKSPSFVGMVNGDFTTWHSFIRIFASAICKFQNFLVSRRGHDTQQGVDTSFLKGSTACGFPLLTSRLNRLIAKEMWGGEQ